MRISDGFRFGIGLMASIILIVVLIYILDFKYRSYVIHKNQTQRIIQSPPERIYYL